MRGLTVLLVAALGLGLAGCAQKQPMLMNAKANSETVGPDEFANVPNRPLVMPADMTALPAPVPGAANLADADPVADAVVALGGRPTAVTRVPSSSAIMARATRFGTDPGIRAALASEDLAFREANRGKPLERLFRVNLYFAAYADQTLDAYAEYSRLRGAGVALPVPPPKGFAPPKE